ncbi:TetR/AcrR family transcriptional regulator [Saccharothrix mutabilis subsp. mutabilis]|uniref:TetR/AcrR family transcriptional regulator n=1 Tax=Saccharothrix mutabilis subsp. mutabilis TaxID=66855 RepID=A0ABN0T3C6_9PSEU
MSDVTRTRRRRADADRSAAAVLRAALALLAERPNASVEDIAAAAGVSRQTVYAHFKTRDALIGAVIDAVTAEVTSELDNARLDEGPAADALLRLLDVSWNALRRNPVLLHLSAPEGDHARHVPVVDHLHRVLARGQESGEFTADAPIPWLAKAIVVLGHAAGEEVAAGRMSLDEMPSTLADSVLRLCGAKQAQRTARDAGARRIGSSTVD